MSIINLTTRRITRETDFSGLMELSEKDRKVVAMLLHFEEAPHQEELPSRAAAIANIADRALRGKQIRKALLSGPKYFLSTLEKALIEEHIEPVYVYSYHPLHIVRPYYHKFTKH